MSSTSVREYNIAVIGAGVSGLSAAAQCAERGATVICLDAGGLPGGLIANVGQVDGYPTPTSGAELANSMVEGCKAIGVSFSSATVTSLTWSNGNITLTTERERVTANAVIVASGARLRQLGVPGETELTGHGVSQCNWCDGGFFKNESVFVIGGGDAAFQAARHLAGFCKSVTIVMRSPTMRARRSYVHLAANNERITFEWGKIVERIVGTDRVKAIVLRNPDDNSAEEHAASGVFVFVGTVPNSEFLPLEITRDEVGLIVTTPDFQTSVAGIFAIGGVRSGYRGQLMSACGEGAAVAAVAVEELQRRELL
jgi:thioredoxin reductase (NADPH)